MAALASTPKRPPSQSGATLLEQYVQGFDRQPAAGRADITKLLERDRKSFYQGALQVLRNGGSARAIQLVASLLVTSGLIRDALMEPALTIDQAAALGRLAMQQDATIDVDLARQLVEDPAATADSRRAVRLLDVLAAISSGSRITSFLMRLMRHNDTMLRSKAVLLVGRNSRSVKWVQGRLGESDPRTRASAVEALWGVDTPEAKDLLRNAARDGNNRVAGNAIIALFRMGDAWCLPELLKMVSSESPLFRATAAWVMGETGDPRFKEALAKLVGEPDAIVRRRAFLALARLKTAAQARQHLWRVAGRVLPAGSGAWRQVRLEVCSSDGATPRLMPTNFAFLEDAKPVAQYQIEEKPSPEALAVTILLPRTPSGPATRWVQGANAALQWKRSSDLWQPAFYLTPRESAESTGDQDAVPPFLPEKDAIAAAFSQQAPKLDCVDYWSSLRKLAGANNAPARGVRHIIAVLSESVDPPSDLPVLISAAMNAKVAVHAISRSGCAELEDLCKRTGGFHSTYASDLELPTMIEEAHLALLARFHISYLPLAPTAGLLQVKVSNPIGSGEALLPLP